MVNNMLYSDSLINGRSILDNIDPNCVVDEVINLIQELIYEAQEKLMRSDKNSEIVDLFNRLYSDVNPIIFERILIWITKQSLH